jgi:hypothetical protein
MWFALASRLAFALPERLTHCPRSNKDLLAMKLYDTPIDFPFLSLTLSQYDFRGRRNRTHVCDLAETSLKCTA